MIEKKRNHKVVSVLALSLPILFFVLTYIPYLVGVNPTLRFFFSSSFYSTIYRAIISIGFASLVIIFNYLLGEKYRTSVLISFCLFCLFVLIGTLLIPGTIVSVTYSDLQNSLIESILSIGVKDRLVGLVNSLFDIFFAFFLLFFCHSFFTKKSILIFLLIVISLSVLECFSTFVLDANDYFSILQGNFDSLYALNISGTFQSKNGLGFLLFQGVVSVIVIYSFTKKRLFKALLIISVLLFLFVQLISFCKTSFFVSALICAAFLIFCITNKQISPKRRRIGISCSISAGCLLLTMVIIVAIPATRNALHLSGIYDSFLEKFVGSMDSTLSARFKIWSEAFTLFKSPFLFFGFSRGCSSYVLQLVDSSLTSSVFHNGFLSVLADYGLIGLFMYLLVLSLVFRQVLSIDKEKNNQMRIAIVLTFIFSLFYSMFESIVLIASGSATSMVQNVVIIVLPMVIGVHKGGSKNVSSKEELAVENNSNGFFTISI